MKYLVLLVMPLLFLQGCHTAHSSGPLKKMPATPVHLNLLDTAATRTNLADLLQPVSFIRLQVPETEALAGVDKVLVYRNQFICVDKKFASLLVFDSDGRFIKKIGQIGKGPGKYMTIEDVFLDTLTGRLTVFSNTSQELVWFNMNNNETGSVPLKFNAWRCVPLENKQYAFYLNFLGIAKNYHNFFLTNDKGNITREDLPYSPMIQSAYDMSGSIVPSGNGYLLAPAFGDTLYYGNADELKPAYILNLGARKVPVSLLEELDHFLKEGKNYSHAGTTMTDLPNALCFDYTDRLGVKFAIYQKNSMRLYTTDRVLTGTLSLLYKTPVGHMPDGKIISPVHISAFPYYQKKYPRFNEELKKDYPALYRETGDSNSLNSPVLAIYSLQQ